VEIIATDIVGNESVERLTVTINKDQKPAITLLTPGPLDTVPVNTAFRYGVRIDDDYVVSNRDRLFTVWSNQSMHEWGTVSAQALETSGGASQGVKASIALDATRLNASQSQIAIDGVPVAERLSDGVLNLHAWNALSGNVSVSFSETGTPVPVSRYRVQYYSSDQCLVSAEQTIENEVPLGDASLTLGMDRVIIEPEYPGGVTPIGAPKRIRIDQATQFAALSSTEENDPTPDARLTPTLVIEYEDGSDNGWHLQPSQLLRAGVRNKGIEKDFYEQSMMAIGSQQSMSLVAYAIDSASVARGAEILQPMGEVTMDANTPAPILRLTEPSVGEPVRPLQWLDLAFNAESDTDIDWYRLLVDGIPQQSKFAGVAVVDDYTLRYQVPASFTSGQLVLGPLVVDAQGRSVTDEWSLPIVANEVPSIAITGFAHFKAAGSASFGRRITDPSRLDLGEFWIRQGEEFEITAALMDDVALRRYEVSRIARDGTRVSLFEREYAQLCPGAPPTDALEAVEILFNQGTATEYELSLTDTFNQRVSRRFIVHPLANMSPEIRITSPANGQFIAAGTFAIAANVAFTDDRPLNTQFGALRLTLNGQELPLRSGNGSVARDAVLEQAYDSMYDAIEARYGPDLADQFGLLNSPYADSRGLVVEIPSGLLTVNEPLTLSAEVTDSEGSVARHSIEIFAAPDDILPELAIIEPNAGFAAIEASEFSVSYRAYDNVKVARLELYTAFGVRSATGGYQRSEFGEPIRVIDAIPNKDALPASTVNIDTPQYRQLVPVPTLANIRSLFSNLSDANTDEHDVWLRLVAIDASGNRRERAVVFPVRIDQRPTVDITEPTALANWVEGSKATVQVNAFDDVGIQQVRMIISRVSTGEELSNLLLREAPYAFEFTVPSIDTDAPDNNRLRIDIEAIDSYGVSNGDPDAHRAIDSVDVRVVADQPPTIAIASPEDGDAITEGDLLLVQVAAIDDVGFERVELTVDGLVSGRRVFTGTDFPYEFAIPVPYGQSGSDITLSASGTERAFGQAGRTVRTLNSIRVSVLRDTLAPELTVARPIENGAAVEKRALPYLASASDDVRVSTVAVNLFVDINTDGSFEETEKRFTRVSVAAPYSGSIAIESIADYVNDPDTTLDALDVKVEFIAKDGAGNETVVNRFLQLQRNAPPNIRAITLLDKRGFQLPLDSLEVTEGREVVVSVTAEDPEAGVDAVRLFRSFVGQGSSEPGNYSLLSEDKAAPFSFAFTVPVGKVGDTLSFRAEATDVDGYESERSDPVDFTIVADAKPQASIIKPVNDESVIVDGQLVEVVVEAFDDLGPDGIDRVVFYVNGTPVRTIFDSVSEQTGALASESIYRAELRPPQGVDGLLVHAVVFDKVGQSVQTAPVRIGRVRDTVAPRVTLVSPVPGEIVTAQEPITIVIGVEDIVGNLSEPHHRVIAPTLTERYQNRFRRRCG